MTLTDGPSPQNAVIDPTAKNARDTGVVLVAHGDRGGEGENVAVRAHADRLRHLLPVDAVVVGLLNGEPGFERALLEVSACEQVHVFPMLMSEGYFTDTAIPERLQVSLPRDEREGVVLHRPLGVLDAMMHLTVRQAREGAGRLGMDPAATSVLLIGHGAKTNTRARQAIEMHERAVAKQGCFAKVTTAYLEEPPFLGDAARRLDTPTVVIGLFISDGMHAGQDVPSALAGVRTPYIYTGALGRHEDVPGIIRDEIARSL